ncbi:hypothetical protein MMC34_008503, partial [Xylographa carneopallida]|nr:hypothetical protein [Xylographa carneopallida]
RPDSMSQLPTIMAKSGPGLNPTSILELNLSHLPAVYVLPVHLSIDQVHDLEAQLADAGAPVIYDLQGARLILGALTSMKRAKFELHSRGIKLQDLSTEKPVNGNHTSNRAIDHSDPTDDRESPSRKRRKGIPVNENKKKSIVSKEVLSTTDVRAKGGDGGAMDSMSQLSITHTSTNTASVSSNGLELDESDPAFSSIFPEGLVKVVRVGWLIDSMETGSPQPFGPYIIYEGMTLRRSESPQTMDSLHSVLKDAAKSIVHQFSPNIDNTSSNVSYAIAAQTHDESGGPEATDEKRVQASNPLRRDFHVRRFQYSSRKGHNHTNNPAARPVPLLRETTSEHDDGTSGTLPKMPKWVKEKKIYACERSTPLYTPNDEFVAQLELIKLERILTGDEIGVRAYSTSIASVRAHPSKLTSTKEILSLPGCDHKIAHLFYEWQTTGHIQAVDGIQADPALTALRSFYNIWGVGAKTAREFYYDRQRRELDDIIEFEWSSLTRVQQIGLKFYDEFELKIPRSEVEYIASIVTYHAKKVIEDDEVECVVVGGYRRGCHENGDVDIIVSHRDESATNRVIHPIVAALETAGWITHSLSVVTANSDRGQQPVSYKFHDDKRGSGFDTLDKALVVWQDPVWPSMAEDLAHDPQAKNPNVHRRVDIIISPWRTIGCAVAGWTSGTTFQRDLRRYAKHRKAWKFDSSGIRERGSGKWVDVERWTNLTTRATTWQDAERRVFEGLGLEYREPWERNTG